PPIQPGAQQQSVTGSSTSVHQGHEAEVMNNPLYQGAETAGNNPLYEATAAAATNPLYTPLTSGGHNPLHRNSFADPVKPLVNLKGE
ncbi:MAG TPA: hypothetical protein VIG99_21415, partial [Myxococcaceae bacterium]